ncbi:hypothetical protein [Streptomyces sp. NBC_01446]|uniref:hypothetical protein n=1 Tax=Streptomyces sp. NBC_01446 TaxID=2903870 RepID=UPI00225710DF|nr:hypothetical protein [Streptomyces sp. NBC_01446]MCX4648090.1 hypothetical protein [Streptomyces sp. NBC_01446]
MHTPFDVHFGLADQLREMRADVLAGGDHGRLLPRRLHPVGRHADPGARGAGPSVYRQHPERFVRAAPEPPKLPEAAWINKPADLRHDDQTITAQG